MTAIVIPVVTGRISDPQISKVMGGYGGGAAPALPPIF